MLTENAEKILNKRYYERDESNNVIEDWSKLCHRVSNALASVENKEEQEYWSSKFYDLMHNLDFLPNSPALRNLKVGKKGMGSACLTGDTIIHTLKGEFTIRDLAKKSNRNFLVYSCDNGRLRIGKAFNPRLTKKNAKVYEITLSVVNDIKFSNSIKRISNSNVVKNGECKIKLTADHLVMMRDGSYKRVDEIKINDSVMPFNHAYYHDRLEIYKNINSDRIDASRFAYEEFTNNKIEKGFIIHHINKNHKDNRPKNLKKMSKTEHNSYHAKVHNAMFTESGRRKISKLMQGNCRAKGCIRSKDFKEALSKNNGMKNKETVNKAIFTKVFKVLDDMKSNGLDFTKFNYNKYKPQRVSSISTLIKNGRIKSFNNLVNLYNNYIPDNHKVISIKYVGKEDVYDLSVEKYHNFAANGIFIHNCFVLPIEDSRDSIFTTLKDMVDVQAFGGGCGTNFSTLRPKGYKIKTTNGKSSGPISFISIFDYVLGNVIQQGGVRHGASMGILNINHPDIEEFITCKNIEGVLSHFNLSVAITDDFMQALKDNNDFNLEWNNKIVKTVKAKYLWDLICENAWKLGEPGVFFIDSTNKKNHLEHIARIVSTNPCGESPLIPYGTCDLGSINLSNHVISNACNNSATIDYAKLKNTISIAVRILDNILDVNFYPIKKIEKVAKLTRSIGLGIMGLADLFIKMHITYGSNESFKIAEEIMEFIYETANKTSIELGKEKGNAPVFTYDKIHNEEFYETNYGIKARRNSFLLAIAPTGTLSQIANCSNGCEPIFDFEYKKMCIDSTLNVSNDLLKEYLKFNKDIPEFFITSSEIDYKNHVKMQACLQKYVDMGISKTINMPNNATIEDISKVYILAYEMGCKGLTVYRDGSRKIQAQTSTVQNKENKVELKEAVKPSKKILEAKRIEIPFNPKWYVILSFLENKPYELFINAGKSGTDDKAWTEAIGRLISLYLQEGGNIDRIVNTLKGIQGKNTLMKDGWIAKSGIDAVGMAIDSILKEHYSIVECVTYSECPECKLQTFIFEGGCGICKNPECGYSNCG